jgi:hypothetical protein
MGPKLALALCLTIGLTVVPVAAEASPGAPADRPDYGPGAPGVGDPYFPLDGNGGYDVKHYDLDLSYDPDTDVLAGTATLRARATQDLSAFNLDFQGLTVRSIEVNHRPATWTRDGAELTVTPAKGIRERRRFTVEVTYDGVPEPIGDSVIGMSGFMATDDGAMVVGQPDVAATWFPANDHPIDKASFTFEVTVPEGLEAIANGRLVRERSRGGETTWVWDARDPMATYLAMLAVGEFDVREYREDGIRFWDAFDPDLFVDPAPRTGTRFALSQVSQPSYKRLMRTITVPAEGAELSFWVTRDTEPGWDHLFVEAHHPGVDDWTTLPDANGHTEQSTGASCPFWLGIHPFLEHYQTDNGDDTCAPTGTTGEWHAISGASDGYEEWTVDLSAYAGSEVEVSISYASDDIIQGRGVFVDDVTVSTGEGTTSFEADDDPLDGWTVPGAPEGSPANPNDWIAGTGADVPPSAGDIAEGSLARQDEIIAFLSDTFGEYPWRESGGIVDDTDLFGFALETQTRPVYSRVFFSDPISGDSVVVHELAHQWYGDSLAVERWSEIWLNEGFATYAEWLWAEHDNLGTVQETFDSFYNGIPEDDPFWQVIIGDPGPDLLFDIAVYWRGAMTLHQLRLTIGDEDFFTLLREWADRQAGGNVTTDEFIALAEEISGQELDELFDAWLFTAGKPDAIAAPESVSTATARTAEPIPFPVPAPLRRPMARR